MPVPVAQGASAPSALKSKEIDNIMEHLVENPTAFVVPTERLAQQAWAESEAFVLLLQEIYIRSMH